MSENTLPEAVPRRGRPHYPRAGPGLDSQSANGPGRDFQARVDNRLILHAANANQEYFIEFE